MQRFSYLQEFWRLFPLWQEFWRHFLCQVICQKYSNDLNFVAKIFQLHLLSWFLPFRNSLLVRLLVCACSLTNFRLRRGSFLSKRLNISWLKKTIKIFRAFILNNPLLLSLNSQMDMVIINMNRCFQSRFVHTTTRTTLELLVAYFKVHRL